MEDRLVDIERRLSRIEAMVLPIGPPDDDMWSALSPSEDNPHWPFTCAKDKEAFLRKMSEKMKT